MPTILVDGRVPAAAITAFGGSHQIALPGTGFAAVLQAKVTDASGNPLPGRAVTFTAPGSGASASFAIATVDTDANGIARSLATANGLSGAYQVTANVEPALAFPAVFQLENRTRLERWREAHFGSYDNSGDGADSAAPWGDGVANLLKYALNLDPTAPDASVMTVTGTKGLPLAGLDAAGRLTFTFVRRSVGTRPGITYTVQFSDDLVAWTSNPSATETATPIDAEFDRVVVADSVAAGAVRRRFVRLLVTTP